MDAFYASNWSDCPSGVNRAIRNPWSGEVIDSVPVCSVDTADTAMVSLRRGVNDLALTTSEEMGGIVGRAVEKIKARGEELARLISNEQGKPIAEARGEIDVVIRFLDAFSRDAYRLGRELLALSDEPRVGDRFGYTRRRPYGIAVLLTPNTYPLLIPAMLLVPALAAGNAVALKPASQTPFSALRLVEILLESGLPDSSLACLTGPGEITGSALCRHALADQITVYGGTATITSIRSQCGLVPVQHHHGGMGVCLVAEDGNLEAATHQLANQAFENAGQTAISTSAVFVAESVCDDLIGRLEIRIRELVAGDPMADETRIGPLTETFRAERAGRLIADLTVAGAQCVCGGGVIERNLVQPTLLAGIDPESQRFFPAEGSREILAPIVGVCPVSGKLEEVAEWLDARTQLSASIFTEDLDRATQLAGKLPVFNAHINGIPTWRDGLIFDPGSSVRLGRRHSRGRVNDLATLQDIVFHPQ